MATKVVSRKNTRSRHASTYSSTTLTIGSSDEADAQKCHILSPSGFMIISRCEASATWKHESASEESSNTDGSYFPAVEAPCTGIEVQPVDTTPRSSPVADQQVAALTVCNCRNVIIGLKVLIV